MKQTITIEASLEDFKKILFEALAHHETMKQQNQVVSGTCSINEAAKTLRVSHTKAKNLIKEGVIKTTTDQRRVLRKSLNEYMNT
jgi:2-hydroxy-3-keto-5-methylthiopentenyl-1-phosphate phosphatase